MKQDMKFTKKEKRFGTEELVKWIEGIAPGFSKCCPPFTIIARLRAADKLCEAAKKAADEWWRITNEAVLAMTTIKMRNYDCFISDQVKAIAEYEEGKC